MKQEFHQITVPTDGQGFYEVTNAVTSWLSESGCKNGMVTVFIRHTSASLIIQENADPDVQHDLRDALARLAPQSGTYRHSSEGPDDMPAHIKSALTSVSLNIPVMTGSIALGTWQGIFLLEHRDAPHHRTLVLHFIGD